MRTTTTLAPVDNLQRRFRDAHTRRALDELRRDVAQQIRQTADDMDAAGDGDSELEGLFAALKTLLDQIDAKISRQAVIDDLTVRSAHRGAADRGFDAALPEFSLRGMIATAIGSPVPGLDIGRSLEISAELRNRPGRTFIGFPVPYQALYLRADYARRLERRDTIGTATPAAGPGGSLIPLTLDGTRYIDALRARTVVIQAGAMTISDLVGDLDLPRMKQFGQVAWFLEGDNIVDTDQQFDRVSFRPKHCGAISTYSRNMLLQAQSPDIEMVLRDDLSKLLALDMDRVALTGSGQGAEPLGVTRNPLVRQAAPTDFGYLNNVDMRAMITGANVPLENLAWVGNSQIDAWSLSVLDAMYRPLGKSIVYLGLPDYTSNVCTAAAVTGPPALAAVPNPLILGAWSDLVISYWSTLDILPNAMADSAYRTGSVMVRALMTADTNVRHPESLVWADVQTGPSIPTLSAASAPSPAAAAAAARETRAPRS